MSAHVLNPLSPSFRHPAGFYVLAFVEFWERLSFYLMKALAALYMVERLGFSAGQASEWMGWYVGAVYSLPLPGGLLADRKLGPLRAAVLGALVMMAGHIAMGVESRAGLGVAMALVALGSGLFKPSMQTLVRGLYKDGDPRIDSAYSQFYLAINAGALLAPLAGYWLRNRYGWATAFEAAAVGLGLGCAALLLLRRFVVDQRSQLSVATGVPLVPDAAMPFQAQDPPDTARRVAAVVAVMLLGSLFWGVANMDAGVLTLWARDCVAGAKKKAELFAAVNPLGILVFTPVIVWLFRRSGTLLKFLVGMGFTALAAAVLAVAAQGSARGIDWRWLLVYYGMVTVGELLVSPISTALVAKIAPPRLCAFLLGVSLLSSSIGGIVSGQLGRLWGSTSHGLYFAMVAGLPVVAMLVLLVLWKPLRELIGEARQERARAPQRPALQVVRGWQKVA